MISVLKKLRHKIASPATWDKQKDKIGIQHEIGIQQEN